MLHTYFKRTAGLIILLVWFWQCSCEDVFCWKVTLIRLMQSFVLLQVLFVVAPCYNCLMLTKRIIHSSVQVWYSFNVFPLCALLWHSTLYCLGALSSLFSHHKVNIPEWVANIILQKIIEVQKFVICWMIFVYFTMHWTASLTGWCLQSKANTVK